MESVAAGYLVHNFGALAHHDTAGPNLMTTVGVIAAASLEREGLALLLEHAGFAIAFEAGSIDDVPPAVPNLFIIDIHSDEDTEGWVGRLASFRGRYPTTRFVLLAARLTVRGWMICSGADFDGYLSKTSDLKVLKRQLHLIMAGERLFPFELVREVAARRFLSRNAAPARAAADLISPAETEILRYLLAGYRNRMIAARLKVSDATVKARMKTVFRKIQVSNRTQAAVWAENHGITPDIET